MSRRRGLALRRSKSSNGPPGCTRSVICGVHWHDQYVYASNLRTPLNPGRILSLGQLSTSGMRTFANSFQLWICLHHTKRRFRRTTQRGWCCGSTTLVSLPTSRTKMNRLLSKKSKKSVKYSQRDIFLGISTNIAAGPLGFRAELEVGPNGERNHPIEMKTHTDPIRLRHQTRSAARARGSYSKARPARNKSFPSRKPPPLVLWLVTPPTGMAYRVSVSDPSYLD